LGVSRFVASKGSSVTPKRASKKKESMSIFFAKQLRKNPMSFLIYFFINLKIVQQSSTTYVTSSFFFLLFCRPLKTPQKEHQSKREGARRLFLFGGWRPLGLGLGRIGRVGRIKQGALKGRKKRATHLPTHFFYQFLSTFRF
jgi:hypothetical protein